MEQKLVHKAIQPPHIKRKLYIHQLCAIYRMEEMETTRLTEQDDTVMYSYRVGILADLTGYGKTSSILGLISRSNKWSDDRVYVDKKTTGNEYMSRIDINYYRKTNCSLVIANSLILSQWERELQHTTLKYSVVATKSSVESHSIENIDLVLCDYNYYHYLLSRHSKVAWKRIVIDEPITTKLQNDLRYIADFIWFVTATPYELFLKRDRFSAIIHRNDDIFNKIVVKNPDDFVKRSFSMPPVNIKRYKCISALHDILQGCVKSNISHLAAAENYTEIVDGENVAILNWIIESKTDKIAQADRIISISRNQKLQNNRDRLQKNLEQLQSQARSYLESNPCYACDKYSHHYSISKCCQNFVCDSCCGKYIQKCYFCSSLEPQYHDFKYNIEPRNNDTSPSRLTKSRKIVETISSCKKTIVYADYNASFTVLKRLLGDLSIRWAELKGAKSSKEKLLENYKNGDVDVLLLTTIQYSAGIDLVATTDIIMYHDMSEALQTQIIGRANRIGRSSPLTVHYLS